MKNIRRFTALFLCFAALAFLFSSCSSFATASFLTYRDQTVPQAIFQYLCCVEKTNYLYELYGADRSTTKASSLQDSPAIWTAADADGKTMGEHLKENVLDSLRVMVYLAQYGVDEGYTLSASDEASVKKNLDSLAANFNTKSEFNELIAQYGVDYDLLYEYYLLQARASIGNYMLFGDNGKMAVTDAKVREYYSSHYQTVRLILINNQSRTYPNGKTVYLPEDEKERKTALADEILEKLKAGEDYAALCRAYSDGYTDEETIASGFTFKSGDDAARLWEKSIPSDAKNGEWMKIETEGGIFLIAKAALDQTKLDAEKDSISDELENELKKELADSVSSEMNVDREYLDSVSVADLVHAQ